MTTERRATNVRWRIMGILFLVSAVAYVQRSSMSVAGKFMMDDLGLSEEQLSFVFGAFILSYTLFQLPGGLLGERFGPRRLLTAMFLLWTLLTILTGLVPTTETTYVLVMLLAVRFLMGISHAPLFPVIQGTVQAWFPPARWAFPTGLLSTGLSFGAAATPPFVAWVILNTGWRESFYVIAPLSLLLGALYYWYARDDPKDHKRVNESEMRIISRGNGQIGKHSSTQGLWLRVICNRDVFLISVVYFCQIYVFYIFFSWFFIYLTNERGFGVLEGGFAAAVPWIVGAVMASVGGEACDRLCKRYGALWGCRIPIVVGLVLVSVFMVAGVFATDAYVALTLLSLCFGFTQFTEGPIWAATTFIGRRHTAAATGVLNTAGNLGGVVSTLLVPYLANRLNWEIALSTGAVLTLVAAALMMFVHSDRPMPQ